MEFIQNFFCELSFRNLTKHIIFGSIFYFLYSILFLIYQTELFGILIGTIYFTSSIAGFILFFVLNRYLVYFFMMSSLILAFLNGAMFLFSISAILLSNESLPVFSFIAGWSLIWLLIHAFMVFSSKRLSRVISLQPIFRAEQYFQAAHQQNF